MKGIPPLSGNKLAAGAGPGESSSRGRYGQGNAGDDDTIPPVVGAGAMAGIGGDSGGMIRFSGAGGGDSEETLTGNFWVSWHALREPLLKVK